MRLPALSLAALMALGATLQAQRSSYARVIILGEMIPPIDSVRPSIDFLADSDRYSQYCRRGTGDTLCVAVVNHGATFGRLEVTADSYQRYVRNIASLRFVSDTAVVRLPPLRLERRKLQLDDITLAIEGDSAYRFKLLLRNRFASDTARVESLEISGAAPRHTACAIGTPYEVYEVRPTLRVVGLDSAGASLAGGVRERLGRADALTPISGSFTFETCSSSTGFTLNLPMRVLLLPGRDVELDIVMPRHFTVTETRHVGAGPSDFFRAPRRMSCIEDALGLLTAFRFHFRTDSRAEPVIAGSFTKRATDEELGLRSIVPQSAAGCAPSR